MNRIIVIGNGFDLAHGIKSGYKDFINDYWSFVHENVFSTYSQQIKETYGVIHDISPYKDEFVNIEVKGGKIIINDTFPPSLQNDSPYCNLYRFIQEHNNRKDTKTTTHIGFKNNLLGQISSRCSLMNWVGVENEYYEALKKLLSESNPERRNASVKKLNSEFDAVKKLLEKYLAEVSKAEIEDKESILTAFQSIINPEEIAVSKRDLVVASIISIQPISLRPELYNQHMVPIIKDKERRHLLQSLSAKNIEPKHLEHKQTLILNFNYTKTAEKLYAESNYEVINIHGELGNSDNPIIFGYGDELDDDYKRIERLQDNDFLENIKSIQYHKTKNYRELLKFIESDPYQVFIMGHSCGNSDRTLLNTLFEHENCVSLKVFYRQFEDGSDDYSNLIRNISRNFNDKPTMRDVVVNWEKCSPLIPLIKS